MNSCLHLVLSYKNILEVLKSHLTILKMHWLLYGNLLYGQNDEYGKYSEDNSSNFVNV